MLLNPFIPQPERGQPQKFPGPSGPLRVLHLVYSFYRGGLESWLITMLQEIGRDVCVMDACCMGVDTGPWAPLMTKYGATVYHCPLTVTHLGFFRGLGRILHERPYDIVHNHLGIYSGFPVWIAHRAGVPVVTTFHNTDFTRATMWWLRLPIMSNLRLVYGRLSMEYAKRHSDLLTGVSKGVLEHVLAGREEWRQKARILYLGVAIPEESTPSERADFRESLGIPADAPLILHVGRFVEQKNHRGLIEVFSRLAHILPQARLLLVGEGPLRPTVERLVESKNLRNLVHFLGFRNDVPRLMTKCDLFLLPSLHEGLPVVCMEALAAGLPVVASKIPGLVEAVDDGATGLLHEVDDYDGMARSGYKILTDRDYSRQLGDAGKARVTSFFSKEAAAMRLLKLYAELLGKDPIIAPQRIAAYQ